MNEQAVIDTVAQLFKAMGDPTRIKILLRLRVEECAVNTLAADLSMNQSAISHQLRLLKALNIVKFKRDGVTLLYSIADEHVLHLLEQAVEHVEHM